MIPREEGETPPSEEQEDPVVDRYANVPPPAETDGPQEPVDPSELEEEAHAVLPLDADDEEVDDDGDTEGS